MNSAPHCHYSNMTNLQLRLVLCYIYIVISQARPFSSDDDDESNWESSDDTSDDDNYSRIDLIKLGVIVGVSIWMIAFVSLCVFFCVHMKSSSVISTDIPVIPAINGEGIYEEVGNMNDENYIMEV